MKHRNLLTALTAVLVLVTCDATRAAGFVELVAHLPHSDEASWLEDAGTHPHLDALQDVVAGAPFNERPIAPNANRPVYTIEGGTAGGLFDDPDVPCPSGEACPQVVWPVIASGAAVVYERGTGVRGFGLRLQWGQYVQVDVWIHTGTDDEPTEELALQLDSDLNQTFLGIHTNAHISRVEIMSGFESIQGVVLFAVHTSWNAISAPVKHCAKYARQGSSQIELIQEGAPKQFAELRIGDPILIDKECHSFWAYWPGRESTYWIENKTPLIDAPARALRRFFRQWRRR